MQVDPVLWLVSIGAWLRGLARHPWPLTCVFGIVLEAALLPAGYVYELSDVQFGFGVVVGAVPVFSWLILREHAGDATAMREAENPEHRALWNAVFLGLFVATVLIALGFHRLSVNLDSEREARVQGEVTAVAARTQEAASSATAVAQVRSDQATAQSRFEQTTPTGAVAAEQSRPKSHVDLTNPSCGNLPARIDITLADGVRAGYYYWVLRSDTDNPGAYPAGPPRRIRPEAPQLTFDVPLPICDRTYRIRVVECDEGGESEVTPVAADWARGATLSGVPDGCVGRIDAELRAIK